MNYAQKIITAIELHSVESIKECFANGINPNVEVNGAPLVYELISEYTRSPRFKDCVQAFVESGLQFDDTVLLSVLLDDARSLNEQLNINSKAAFRRYTLRSAYTPLYEASLLHICAEFNHCACAQVLVEYGLDINVRAGIDKDGFGGQTPIFHTVNQNGHQSKEMLLYLLSKSADLSVTVAGLVWGKGYDWETLIPSVNPISYAMMGLLPQMHRDEVTIAAVVTMLLQQRYGMNYTPANVPCKYLQ